MAEYYAVLKKAVGGLDAGSAEARRAVYDKARNALIGQLKAIDPPLAASEISRQRLELEEAIRRVERETASETRRSRLAQPSESAPPSTNATAPAAPEQSDTHSPQDVFRRAIQEAEARGTAAAHPPKPAPPPRQATVLDEDDASARAPGGWTRPGNRKEVGPAVSAPPVTADLDDDWQAENAELDQPPEPYAERQGRSPPPQRPQDDDDYFDADEAPEPAKTGRRSSMATLLIAALIIALVGGIGALAWTQRTIISDIMAGFDNGSTEDTASETAPPPPDTQSKSEDRIADGAEPSAVRVIGDSSTPAPPAPSGTTPDPIGETIADLPMQAGEASAGAQKAVLYEEPLDAAAAAEGVTAIEAAIDWRFVENGTSGAEVAADIEIPERGMTISLVIRRNTDATLPASHLVETVITTPPDFPGAGIRSVPRLVLKPTENERGAPLIGAAAKVADGFFWIALSAADADVQRNLQLLRDSPWIDLPMVYENGQRTILTFEKGPQGTEVFERAFAAWNTG